MRLLRCARPLCFLFLMAGPLGARSAAAQAAADSALPSTGTPVTYGADTLFQLHGRLGPFGPAERAAAIVQRLARWAPALAAGRDSIFLVDVEQRTELLVGDAVLMTVLETDAAAAGQPRPALAAAWARRIQQAVTAGAAAASLQALAFDAAKSLAATLALLVVLLGLRRLAAGVQGVLASPRVPPLRIKRFELLSAARLSEALAAVTRILRAFLTLLLFYFYLTLVLSFFPWTAPYARRIVDYVRTPLLSLGAGFLDYLPKVFFLLVIVLVTRYALKVVALVFRAVGTGALVVQGFHREWAQPTLNIIRFLVIAFAAVVMFPYLPGAESPAFQGVSLFVGVLFSLGSSGALGHIVAGVVLTYTNAFRLGDRVQIGDTVGDVVQRTMLVTRVRTIKNVDVTVPNATVLSSQLINFTTQAAGRGLILHTTVTIGYDAPWRQVHALLIAAACATEHILPDPAPFVLQTALGDFAVSYQINGFTDQPALMAQTYSALHQHIQDGFSAAGVEIMSPHYAALRDGNRATIPADRLPADYRAPAFRVADATTGDRPR
ncbi:MAG: mechanosensitive ion channel family protein [Gemmatimonadetes bacterium]|nr:mechanosensitive ion channel family protein [Gemmatimonadota bacterium]MBK6779970.1 mechanosensitive ion channel family protein [Gemmatimonadota bacterium]MBK7717512.1 mechanosensitive ion channel family protein [Gemmatimonadota bacterium]MBK7785816.1 mechanosensitive ion channel family protein [Gemmatimonadota bacterium]MBK9690135.1 mechanosensitive ion channel family protein [Gemmatimonadota bacterium]